MLSVRIPSYETYRIATRPAILASLDKMLDYFDINVNQQVFFNDEAEVSLMLGGLGTDKRGSDTTTDFGYGNKLFIELESTESGYNDGLDAYSGNGSNPAFWYEPLTQSKIIPKFNTRKFDITVNAFFKDRVTAQRYLTNIKSKTFSPHQNTLFDVDTHFPTTYPQLECFKNIYDRLLLAGKVDVGKGFIDWMIDHSVVPSGILRNAAFNAPVFVFKQKLVDIGVIMENPNMAMVNQGAYTGKFEVSFKYSFYWSEHVEWIMEYPIQIYQQPMPEDYLPTVFENNKEDFAKRRFFECAASYLVWDYEKNFEPFYQVFPTLDNWRPNPTAWVSPQLQVLINVENIENQILLNMKEINGFTWNKKVIDYIIKFRSKVTLRHHNPLNIKVYSTLGMESEEVLETQIELLENGDLVLTRLPRMENIYRVVFSFDYAVHLYTDDCVSDILSDLEWGRWIIGVLFPNKPLPDNWGDNGYSDWIDFYNDTNAGGNDKIEFYMTYGLLYSLIVAKHSDSYQTYLALKNKGELNGTDYNRWDEATSK